MNLGGRIRRAREHLGWQPKDLERESGVANTTINALEMRDSRRSEYTEQLVMAFPANKINRHWLRTGEGEMTAVEDAGRPVLVIHDGEPLPDGVVYIPESEIRLSGGPGQVAYTDTPGSIAIPYMADWLTKAGIPHGKGRRFKIRGESMEETLFDGDTVLVNTADKDVVDGKVYAFTWDGDFRVKRLFRRMSGGLVIHSDNPRFLPRDEEFTAEEVDEHIYIIGRVKDKSGSGGL